MGTKNQGRDMSGQGLILEDFWWKNQGFWSWDGKDTDRLWVIKKSVYGKGMETICGIWDSEKEVGKVWVGSRVTLVYLGIFWDFSERDKAYLHSPVYASRVYVAYSSLHSG